MKKNIVIIAAMLIMSILTACDTNSQGGGDEIVEKEFDIIVEDDLSSYDEKKLDLTKYSVENNGAIDAETHFLWFDIACSNNGYYYKHDNSYIYFFDKITETMVPLCSKSECNHMNEDCNSYFDSSSFHLSYLQFYDGYLYTLSYDIDGNIYLHKISEDGSSREQYMTLYKQELTTTSGGTEYRFPEICIHRGYVYYTVPDEKYPRLYRKRLGGEDTEVLFELQGERGSMYRIRPYGDFVFFQAGHFTDETMVDINAGIFAYNVNSGEMNLLKQDVIATYVIVNNRLYYDGADGIYEKDLIKETEKKLVDKKIVWGSSVDGQYIYIEDETRNNIEVYDLQGEYVCKISVLTNQKVQKHYFGDGEYVFLYSQFDNGDTREQLMAYFKVSDIAEGNLKWKYNK